MTKVLKFKTFKDPQDLLDFVNNKHAEVVSISNQSQNIDCHELWYY